MKKKQLFIFILSVLILFIINQVITTYLAISQNINTASLTDNTKISPQKLYERTWKEVKSEFYDKSLNNQDWSYWKKRYKGKIKTEEDAQVAIDTMITSLNDNYTRFLSKKEYAEQNTSIESKISGIGVNIMNNSGKIIVHSVIDNTPAKIAGIKPNDIIIKVDNNDVTGMNVSDVAALVRGKENTVVCLKLIRNKKTIYKYIRRKSIKIESVKSHIKNNIGYIQISSFIGNDTSTEFVKALKNTKNTKGLILDLRGNTGGLLSNAIFIANMFMGNETIVNIVSRQGKIETIKAQTQKEFINKPMVILVDGASASASEILSGALKDNKKAILVGTKTYGKGMVQRIIPLPNATGLNLTIAKYLTPNGYDINKKGITPDYIVKYTEIDFKNHKDPQLEKAEKILAQKIKQ